jgi:hypothetical protein
VSVKVLLVLVLMGLKAAVIPLGSPDSARFTLPLKPFWPATLIVLTPTVPPTKRVRPLAEEERLNPCARMVSRMLVVLLALPDVPVTVTLYVPGAAVLLMVKVSEVVLELTAANAAATPAGTPDAVRVTLLARPIGLITVISTGLL